MARIANPKGRCDVCRSGDGVEIEAMILAGVDDYAVISRLTGIGRNTIQRHATVHMGVYVGTGQRGKCAACIDPRRVAIDAALLSNHSTNEVSSTFGLSRHIIAHHTASHLRFQPFLGGRGCPICEHPEIDLIEGDLARGYTIKAVEDVFGLPKGAVRRHREPGHMERYAAHAVRRLEAVERYVAAS